MGPIANVTLSQGYIRSVVLLHMVLTFMPQSICAVWLIYGCSGNHYVYINFNFLSFVCSLYHLSKTKFSLRILVLNQLSADGGTGEMTSSDFNTWPFKTPSCTFGPIRHCRCTEVVLFFDLSGLLLMGCADFGPLSPWDLAKTFLLSFHGPYLPYHNSFSGFCFPLKCK